MIVGLTASLNGILFRAESLEEFCFVGKVWQNLTQRTQHYLSKKIYVIRCIADMKVILSNSRTAHKYKYKSKSFHLRAENAENLSLVSQLASHAISCPDS